MSVLRNISLEYKSTALFSVMALLLSLLSGMAAGIDGLTVVLRSFLITLVFAILGFIIIVVLKRFVPEMYQFIDTMSSGNTLDVNIDDESEDTLSDSGDMMDAGIEQASAASAKDMKNEEVPDAIDDSVEPPQSGFTELSDKEYERMESHLSIDDNGPAQSGASSKSFSSGGVPGSVDSKKMGKHIIVEDEFVRYEPKLMAEAVRTMMRKDE